MKNQEREYMTAKRILNLYSKLLLTIYVRFVIFFLMKTQGGKEMDSQQPSPCSPSIVYFDLRDTGFSPVDEEFVDIYEYSNGEIQVDMQYYKMNIKGAINKAYVRKTVGDMLLIAQEFLPEGYHLKIWDAWRPYEVQKSLYKNYYKSLKKDKKNKGLSRRELHQLASKFVSYPDKKKNPSFVHSSGGAVDLTITDKNGNELDMGTDFDDFSEKAYFSWANNSFEATTEQKQNRWLLFNVMKIAGFTHYPYEWWHYDYGDIFYGSTTGKKVKYGSVFKLEKKD